MIFIGLSANAQYITKAHFIYSIQPDKQ